MPHDDMQDADLETPSISPPTQSQESQEEYLITIRVTSEGFDVNGEQVADLTTALKHVILLVREHPMSGDAQEELASGYNSA